MSGGLLILAIGIIGLIGWVSNVVKLASMCCDVSGWLVLRAIGVCVPPLGAVLGFL